MQLNESDEKIIKDLFKQVFLFMIQVTTYYK